MGVLPTKGLTLPLLSYGRSSLLVSLAWLGVLLRIYHEVKWSSRSAVMREAESRSDERCAGAHHGGRHGRPCVSRAGGGGWVLARTRGAGGKAGRARQHGVVTGAGTWLSHRVRVRVSGDSRQRPIGQGAGAFSHRPRGGAGHDSALAPAASSSRIGRGRLRQRRAVSAAALAADSAADSRTERRSRAHQPLARAIVAQVLEAFPGSFSAGMSTPAPSAIRCATTSPPSPSRTCASQDANPVRGCSSSAASGRARTE